VVSEGALSGEGFDLVIIASLNPVFVRAARDRLTGLGVSDRKVLFYAVPQDIGAGLSGLRKLASTFGLTSTSGNW
jgi:hypothetical protein